MDDLPKILEGVEGKFIETSRIKIFTSFCSGGSSCALSSP